MSNKEHGLFRVAWRFHNSKQTVVRDFSAQRLWDVLGILEKSEGVSAATTESLVIHLINPNNTTMEVFAHEPKPGTAMVPTNVVNIVDRMLDRTKKDASNSARKPHVRLKTTQPPQSTPISYGLYHVYEAL